MAENLRPKKRLGQHFLTDPTYCRRIASLAEISEESLVIEIGPGTGQLTEELLARKARVVALEIDADMTRLLNHRFPDAVRTGRLTLVEGDILKVDPIELLQLFPASAAEAGLPKAEILGNLPYNIATHTLQKMTLTPVRFQKYTFMVQKEVASRILAQPGSKDYGYLTLLLALHFIPRPGFDVPAGAFRPPPKVLSHVLQLVPRSKPLLGDLPERKFLRLIQTAFRHRRKTLRSNLKSLASTDRLKEVLRQARIPENARPEEVSLPGFISLVRVLSSTL